MATTSGCSTGHHGACHRVVEAGGVFLRLQKAVEAPRSGSLDDESLTEKHR
jgi:hypothetical protein